MNKNPKPTTSPTVPPPLDLGPETEERKRAECQKLNMKNKIKLN